jgi:hypothetical protein
LLSRSIRRFAALPRIAPVPRLPAQQPQEEGRSEVKRRRAGASHGEPRTETPSEDAEAGATPADWEKG